MPLITHYRFCPHVKPSFRAQLPWSNCVLNTHSCVKPGKYEHKSSQTRISSPNSFWSNTTTFCHIEYGQTPKAFECIEFLSLDLSVRFCILNYQLITSLPALCRSVDFLLTQTCVTSTEHKTILFLPICFLWDYNFYRLSCRKMKSLYISTLTQLCRWKQRSYHPSQLSHICPASSLVLHMCLHSSSWGAGLG